VSKDGQGTKCRRNIPENFNRLSRVRERYRQTDGRAIAYGEREREFTFAKNEKALTRGRTDHFSAKKLDNQLDCVNAVCTFGATLWRFRMYLSLCDVSTAQKGHFSSRDRELPPMALTCIGSRQTRVLGQRLFTCSSKTRRHTFDPLLYLDHYGGL